MKFERQRTLWFGENNPFYGRKHTEETRDKIRETLKAKYTSGEIVNPIKGKCHAEKTRRKISNALRGKPNLKRRKRIIKICPVCGKKWETIPSDRQIHCSRRCRHVTMRGKNHPLYGVKIAEIYPQISKAVSERNKLLSREDSPTWRGGKSFEPYGPEFNAKLRKFIKQRDGYCCQLCGINEEKSVQEFYVPLSIHHIDYDKKNNVSQNLITLCVACNAKVNFNRTLWETRLKNEIPMPSEQLKKLAEEIVVLE